MSKLRELAAKYDFSGIDPETGQPWSPSKVAQTLGIRAYNDPEELRPIRSGKKKVVGRLLKEVFDETLDGANPQVVQSLIDELLTP